MVVQAFHLSNAVIVAGLINPKDALMNIFYEVGPEFTSSEWIVASDIHAHSFGYRARDGFLVSKSGLG